MNRALIVAASLLLAAPSFARAQDVEPAAPDRCSMAMHGMMMGMMGGGMGEMRERTGGMREEMREMPHQMMLEHVQETLGLADDQVERMRQLHESTCGAARPHHELAMEARSAAVETLMTDDPDLARYRELMEEAAAHTVEAQVALAEGMVRIQSVLTREQRERMRQMHRTGGGR